ncbi:MAG TPA: heavy metal-binding domain-containing protein [Phycisphaerales bacterium]|nr:heavy metal-binding domain-containing protein [Phycisphaerales bacterium]
MEGLFVLGMSVSLVVVGLIAGRAVEAKHLRDLAIREQALRHVATCNLRRLPANLAVQEAFLVTGTVAVANDYFKTFASGLRNLFGGEMRSYRSLMERARREAMCRMLAQADAAGARIVWNVRYETACLHGQERNKPGGVEVIVYGTALKTA